MKAITFCFHVWAIFCLPTCHSFSLNRRGGQVKFQHLPNVPGNPLIVGQGMKRCRTSVQVTPESQNDTSDATIDSSTSMKKYPPTPSFRECFSFALPALGIYACPPLMSLIDASFIGRTSSLELAALGPAGSISDCAPLPLLFLSIGATNLVAQAYAKGDKASCAKITRTALAFGTICGIFLGGLLYFFATPLSYQYCGGLKTGKSACDMAILCAKYVSIRAIAFPSVVVAMIAQAA